MTLLEMPVKVVRALNNKKRQNSGKIILWLSLPPASNSPSLIEESQQQNMSNCISEYPLSIRDEPQDQNSLLPDWERRTDNLERMYYVDHNTRNTSWLDFCTKDGANYARNRYV